MSFKALCAKLVEVGRNCMSPVALHTIRMCVQTPDPYATARLPGLQTRPRDDLSFFSWIILRNQICNRSQSVEVRCRY